MYLHVYDGKTATKRIYYIEVIARFPHARCSIHAGPLCNRSTSGIIIQTHTVTIYVYISSVLLILSCIHMYACYMHAKNSYVEREREREIFGKIQMVFYDCKIELANIRVGEIIYAKRDFNTSSVCICIYLLRYSMLLFFYLTL